MPAEKYRARFFAQFTLSEANGLSMTVSGRSRERRSVGPLLSTARLASLAPTS